MHIVRYRKYPNNEIRSVHYYSPFPRKGKDSEALTSNVTSENLCASEPESEVSSSAPSYLTLGAISDSGERILSHKKTRFGLNAKNTLLRMGGAYDTLSINPSDFVFLTGTLPGNTYPAFWAIAEYSSYIAESIGHWLQRTVKSKYYFYVWELQKRGALHFHYCVYCPSSETRSRILAGFKPKWTALLDDISQRSDICLWEGASGACWTDRYGTLQAYAQEVHTSVAAYLSGYFGDAKNKHSQDKDSPYYPRRWWGASRASTTLLKGLTEEVVSEHNNYRGARLEMSRFYETVSHETSFAHHYSHKVGIGSTTVSYHPEDKGQSIWQGLQKMSLRHKHHPHIASLILLARKARSFALIYVPSLTNLNSRATKLLLEDLTDSVLWDSLQRWTLQDTHLRILNEVRSQLHTVSHSSQSLQECIQIFALMEDMLILNQSFLEWNKYGWLCNHVDIPYTVDSARILSQSSTTDLEGSDAQGGAAHGSLSPQNSPSPTTQLSCLSDL